ncbi:senescence-specific cysteine protease SAG39-like isoform A [Micractinium conductrix]|uniref:Senescence-specific cysteine protease SAG39-like isoform A n=1 Tax=Micractinium conductrix TaxID=554055 RepID=A0A2P6VJF3_9CHLO|nr:senescence-specific cysteine protease SAG39-like isoform A [Micractinium conductrix]|eukprot:PSC74223.1 senescence-specific cysteine protease SAG39-like isoform A [Micractinium conductrix]
MESPLKGYGIPPLETTSVYVSAYLDRLLQVDEDNYRWEVICRKAGSTNAEIAFVLLQAVLYFYVSWLDPTAYAKAENATIRMLSDPSFKCSQPCSNLIDNAMCCDGMYLPALLFKNAYGFPQDREIMQNIFSADDDSNLREVRVHGVFYQPMDFSHYPFDEFDLSLELKFFDPSNIIDTTDLLGAPHPGVNVFPSSGGKRLYTYGKGDDASSWAVVDFEVANYTVDKGVWFDAWSDLKSHPDDPMPLAPVTAQWVAGVAADGRPLNVFTGINDQHLVVLITVQRFWKPSLINNVLPVILVFFLALLIFACEESELATRLEIVVTLFLALTAVQFVVAGALPTSSYVVPTQQLVLTTYVFLFLLAIESIVVYHIVTRPHKVQQSQRRRDAYHRYCKLRDAGRLEGGADPPISDADQLASLRSEFSLDPCYSGSAAAAAAAAERCAENGEAGGTPDKAAADAAAERQRGAAAQRKLRGFLCFKSPKPRSRSSQRGQHDPVTTFRAISASEAYGAYVGHMVDTVSGVVLALGYALTAILIFTLQNGYIDLPAMRRSVPLLVLCLLAAAVAAAGLQHDGPARAARRRSAFARAARLAAGLKGVPHTGPDSTSQPPAAAAQTAAAKAAAAKAAAAAKLAAIPKPKGATKLPSFVDLFKKDKSAQVSAILQKLSKVTADPAAMRLLFSQWKKRFHKSYKAPAADKAAFKKFSENVRALAAANLKNPKYFRALNQYSDMLWQDKKQRVLLKLDKKRMQAMLKKAPKAGGATAGAAAAAALPASVDWRAKGKVTPVGDQGACGSCWIWATTAAAESRVLIQAGKSASSFAMDLSEGQMVDCMRGNACNGGYSDEAFNWMARKPVVQEGRYPYGAYRGTPGQCRSTAGVPRKELTQLSGQGYQMVAPRSATALMQAVAKQPVVIYFAASDTFTNGYDTGIYRQDCDRETNHAMLVVGYNRGSGPGSSNAWWLIKNSWSKEPEPEPVPTGCEDVYPGYCPSWAKAGACESSPDFMIGTPEAPGSCLTSCNFCQPKEPETTCKDANDNCAYWASIGECDAASEFMLGSDAVRGACRQSCGACDGDGDNQEACSDWVDSCAYWAQAGECARSSDFMSSYCPNACGLCEDVVVPTECSDTNYVCSDFAATGWCTNSVFKQYMTDNCPAACGFCQTTCMDRNVNCEWWAQLGACQDNPDYMHANCPDSCWLCDNSGGDDDVTQVCEDQDENCEAWAMDFLCDDETHGAWMQENCRVSCDTCGQEDDWTWVDEWENKK